MGAEAETTREAVGFICENSGNPKILLTDAHRSAARDVKTIKQRLLCNHIAELLLAAGERVVEIDRRRKSRAAIEGVIRINCLQLYELSRRRAPVCEPVSHRPQGNDLRNR